MNIILLRSNECHYCHDFYPVFMHTKDKMKDYNFIDYNVMYDEKKIKKQYPKIDLSKVGVPTVFIEHKNKLAEINTAIPDAPDGVKNSYKKFKSNIVNGFKTLNDKNYTTYAGGSSVEYKIKKYEYKLKEKNIRHKKSNELNEKTYKYLKDLYYENTR